MASGRSRKSGNPKYNFQLGEIVLCFEPDPTKARVLYDAKILETAHVNDKSGHKMPAYRIHFQGWNSSWDRTVGENYILKSSDENRSLMKKLADTAKCYRNNKARKNKIDDILEKAFKHKPLTFDSDTESSEDSSSSDDCNKKNGRNGTSNGNEEEDTSDDDIGIELTIPKVLREKLEEDFYMINKKKKFLRLPAETNVISVLEGYVKNFSVNVLYGLSDRWKPRGSNKHSPMEMKSIPICREVVDGIRICFDFSLSTILLYAFERDHFAKFMNRRCGQNEVTSQQHPKPTENAVCSDTSKMRDSSLIKCAHEQQWTKQSSESCTKVRKISRNSVTKSNYEDLSVDSDCTIPLTPTSFSRRVTRQFVAETAKTLKKPRGRRKKAVWRGFGRRTSSEQNGQQPEINCKNNNNNINIVNNSNSIHSNSSSELQVHATVSTTTTTMSVSSVANNCDENKTVTLSSKTTMQKANNRTLSSSAVSQKVKRRLSLKEVKNAIKTEPTEVDTTRLSPPPPPAAASTSTLPVDVHIKTEETLPSSSSSSYPHPHFPAMINPSSAESSTSSLHNAANSCHGWPCNDLLKEIFHSQPGQGSIDEILTWKLLPQSIYSQCPPQPSVVCGPHQLLRLFVKLPEVLGKMDLPEIKLGILLRYLENFLEYMAARHEDLFPASAYVDAV